MTLQTTIKKKQNKDKKKKKHPFLLCTLRPTHDSKVKTKKKNQKKTKNIKPA